MIFMWLLSLLALNVYGASIPPQPVIPTTSACLQGCFESGSVVNAAFDLLNFESIAMDIENFCSINAALLNCGRGCPAEILPELEARTNASSFICGNKIEEFRMVSKCLKEAGDISLKCATECGVPSVVPLRFDSSPAASVNPTVFLDGVAAICKKQICHVRCSYSTFNKQCPGAGDLFMDVVRHQVQNGIDTLNDVSTNENLTTVRLMAENYVKNLPTDCAFLKDLSEFEKVFAIAEANKDSKDSEQSTALPSERTVVTAEEDAEEDAILTEPSEVEGARTPLTDEEDEGFVTESDIDPTSDHHASSEMPPSPPNLGEEKEAEDEEEDETVETASFVVTEEQENKTDIDMDVNAVEATSPTPSEPVIVVDNTSDDVEENVIKAGLKDEVKSSSAFVIVSSTLFFAVASMLLI